MGVLLFEKKEHLYMYSEKAMECQENVDVVSCFVELEDLLYQVQDGARVRSWGSSKWFEESTPARLTVTN